MKNTNKTVRLVAILSLCFLVLEISTTTAMPVNEVREEDRELRSALESFLQDSDSSNKTILHSHVNKNGTDSSNNNSTQNQLLTDELIDDFDLMDTSGSADDANHENDEGDFFLKPKLDSTLPSPLPSNQNNNSTITNLTSIAGSVSSDPKSEGASDSNRPVVAQSGPVDNTDLSLEQPDLPNHENKVVKEGFDKGSQHPGLSDTNHTLVDIKNDSSINITKGKMENESFDLPRNNNSDSTKSEENVEGASTTLPKNGSRGMPSNTSIAEAANRTVTSKKKLLHFLDISENYTKSVHNVTHKLKNVTATNSSSSNVQDKQLTTMEGSSEPTLLPPGQEKQSEEDEGTGEGSGTTNPPSTANPPSTDNTPSTDNPPSTANPGVHAPQPIHDLPAVPRLQTKPYPAQVNLVNLLRNPYESYQTGQNVISPNDALNSKQALHNSLYQNNQWQNRYKLQMNGRQSQLQPQGYQQYPGYREYPSYQGYQSQFLGQPSQGSYSNDGGLYQRSRVEYPNTLLDSNGNKPKVSQQFEDALFESGQRNANELFAESTVKSLQPNSMMPAYGQNTRFYTSGQNNLGGRPGEQPLGGQQSQGNMSKKQAYNVYQAAIYLADLLKNESIKLDQMASGQHKNTDKDDDLFEGESDKGSGESITLDQPQSPVHSTLLSDKQVDKLIQDEDLEMKGVSESETSGKSPNNVPDFKSSSHSLEEPEIYSPSDSNKDQDENSMEDEAQIAVDEPEVPAHDTAKQSVTISPHQETKPAVQENADSTAAVQPQVTDAAPVALQPLDTAGQQSHMFKDEVTQPGTPVNTDSAPATQPQAPMDTNAQQTQSFVADNTAQQEATMNTVPDQTQSFMQQATPVQPEAQPAVNAYDAAAPEPADASATQQTFNDATLSTQQADYQGNTVSAFNAQQPADTTNNAAAIQQWDTTAPQESQQYNDLAAATSPQAAQTPQTSTTNSYAATEAVGEWMPGKSHTIQLDEERYRTLICQNGQDTISCPPNKQISIRNANYGSMGASACLGRQSFTPSQMCKTPGAYEIVKTNCDDMENCELMANDDIFGNECQTDKKYLDLEYDCVPGQCK